MIKCTSLLAFLLAATCVGPAKVAPENSVGKVAKATGITVGAERTDVYLPKLAGKKVALVVNHSSLVGATHLADTLLRRGVGIVKIFAPEHGFRGTADAGETVKDGRDARTGLPLISLYGKNKKPKAEDLTDVDVLVFDIQDVGTRFYTYISTLFYVAEACAENGKTLLVLDRPNPNGHFVDGPVLEMQHQSFVGIAPIPVAHGCTVAELARIFSGENWIQKGQSLDLQTVACLGYDHKMFYDLPVRPSPNLPDMRSVYLYPSLCFFEGTVVSVGRGTDSPFSVIGYPDHPDDKFFFTPQPTEGSKYPPYQGKICWGLDLRRLPLDSLRRLAKVDLSYLLDFYAQSLDKKSFFLSNNFIDKLAGTSSLREQIVAGKTESEIRATWQPGLERFWALRARYLLYE